MCVCVCGIGSSHNFRLFLAVKSCNFFNLPQSLFFMTLTFLKIFCKMFLNRVFDVFSWVNSAYAFLTDKNNTDFIFYCQNQKQ